MRHYRALLAPTVLVGGCSLIYNPSNIGQAPADATDAPMIDMGEVAVDVEIRMDSMPLDLSVDSAFPETVDEGVGTGGSRKGLVVLRGHNFIKDPTYNLSVTLAPATAGAVTLDSFEVSGNNDYIALELTSNVTDTCDLGTSVPVDVTVTQSDGAGGTVSKTLTAGFSVTCLNELDAAPTSATDLDDRYSRVAITGNIDLGTSPKPALIRSVSTISITGTIDVSASGATAGPGGGAGGSTAMNGGGLRPGGGGLGTVSGASGGGAGFVISGAAGAGGGNAGTPGAATGTPWIASYASNGGSGGGGGANSATGTGGAGGGGGGTLELTAPGDITVGGAVTANGGNYTAGGTLAGDGGGGTGGVVIVRTGGTLVLPSIAVTKGNGPGATGASSDGRIRVDAAKGNYPTGGTACASPVADNATCTSNKGPMLVDLPIKTTTQMNNISLRGLANDNSSTLRVFDTMGNPVAGNSYAPVFGTTGSATVMNVVLKAGYNNVCVWVAGAAPDVDESVNCFSIAYLPP